MLSIIFLVITSIISNLDSSEDENLLVYLSPLTTEEHVAETNEQLKNMGHDISIERATFNEEGRLVSYDVSISLTCEKEAYNLNHSISLKNDVLGAIFISDNCQHGAYSAYSVKNDLAKIFFKGKKPKQTLIAWDGVFDDLKGKKAKDF